MTRKPTRSYSLSVVAPFIAILTLLIDQSTLAQVADTAQPSGRPYAASASPAASNRLRMLQQRLLPRPNKADKHPFSRNQSDILGIRGIEGGIMFLPPITYDMGGAIPLSIVVADVNGDGKSDLITANGWSDTVGVAFGNGDGSFQPLVTYGSGGNLAVFVAVEDVNEDGIPDLLVVNDYSNNVGVLLGKGDGTFQSAVTYASGGVLPQSIAAADLNGDGKPDLVVANGCNADPCSGGAVGVLLGIGDGTFQAAVTYGGLDADGQVVVADVNGDRKPDLVVAGGFSTVAVLLGNGDGSFQPVLKYGSGGTFADSVAVADVNGDGKPDLVIANCAPNGGQNCPGLGVGGVLGVLLGNGDGTFQQVMTYDMVGTGVTSIPSVAITDVNGDGKPDVIIALDCLDVDCNETGGTEVLTGDGHGDFQPAGAFASGGEANSLAVVDVNADHRPDLLVANWEGTVGVLLNNTAPPRSTKTVVATSGSPSYVGQPVTFTATVTSVYGAIPDGELVTFYDGATTLASAALAGGIAAYTTSSLSVKTHSIKATYAGDATFKPSTGWVTQMVVKYPTATTLSSSLNFSNYGQPVTLTATVTSAGPAPTGWVIFKSGSATLGSKTLNASGVATLTTAKIPVGADTLTSTYNGDAFNGKSVSAAITQTVSQASLSMVLTSTPNPSTFGESVKFTATLTSNGGLPSGQPVTFSDRDATLGTANVNSKGVATFHTTLPRGSHAVTAAYAGTVDYSPASATMKQLVK